MHRRVRCRSPLNLAVHPALARLMASRARRPRGKRSVGGGKRKLVWAISSSWEAAAAKRPTFAELLPRLREILRDIDGASVDADLKALQAISYLEVK